MISTPQFERSYSQFDPTGIPFFFGICCFAFEGNTVTLEIYRKMENKKRDFTKALGLGLAIATMMFMLTGILFYHAFAQYTQPHLIMNLVPTDTNTYMIKSLYIVGVTSGYILQIAPLFNLFDKYFLQWTEEDERSRVGDETFRDRRRWSYMLRAALATVTCLVGYKAGDFSTYLNL